MGPRGESGLASPDAATAAAYANHGAGRPPRLTQLARRVEKIEPPYGCAAAALRIAGGDNPVAGASPRFAARVTGGGHFPDRGSRARFRVQVGARCGRADVDMMASEGPLPAGRLWRFPGVDMIELVFNRLLRSARAGRRGEAFRFVPIQPLSR